MQKAMLKRLAFLIAIFLATSNTGWSQVAVHAQLDTSDIMIGDQIGLTLFINHAPGAEIDRIDWAPLDEVKELEVLNYGELNTVAEGSEILLEQRVTVTSFDSGYYFIPQIPVYFKDNGKTGITKTERLALMVNTIEAQSDSTQIAPIKDIVKEPLSFIDFIPYLAGLLVLIALGLLLYYFVNRKNRKEAPTRSKIILPSHEIALEKLEALKEAKLWQRGEIKTFQSELTFIIREYLENRFKIPALESTTSEISRQFKTLDIEKDWVSKLLSIFQTADLVKFAKAEPPVDLHTRALDEAEAFIVATKTEETAIEVIEEAEETPASVPALENTVAAPKLSEQQPKSEIALKSALELAGFWPRFFARLIDVYLFPLLLIVISFGVGYIFNIDNPPSYYFIIYMVFFFLFLWSYFALMESSKGGTFGKLILGIRVVTVEGEKLSIGRATLRFIGKIISEGLFLLGYILYFFDKQKRQTLHDKLAGTIVIKKDTGYSNQTLDAGLD